MTHGWKFLRSVLPIAALALACAALAAPIVLAQSSVPQLPGQPSLLGTGASSGPTNSLPGAPSLLGSSTLALVTPLASPVPVPTAIPTPSARSFNCSCFGAATGTEWAGSVTATSYFAASQQAVGQCAAYLNRFPQSPYISAPQAVSPQVATSPFQQQQQAASLIPPANGPQLNVWPALTGTYFCTSCACN